MAFNINIVLRMKLYHSIVYYHAKYCVHICVCIYTQREAHIKTLVEADWCIGNKWTERWSTHTEEWTLVKRYLLEYCMPETNHEYFCTILSKLKKKRNQREMLISGSS